jgi:hypothetical protein
MLSRNRMRVESEGKGMKAERKRAILCVGNRMREERKNLRGIASFSGNLQTNCIVGMGSASKLHFSHGIEVSSQ